MEQNSTHLKPSTSREIRSLTEIVVEGKILNSESTKETETMFKLNQRAVFVMKHAEYEEITFSQGTRVEKLTKTTKGQQCFYVEPEIHVILKVRTAKTSLYPSKPKQKKISKNGIEIEFLSEVMHRNSGRTSWVFYPVGEDISEESMKRYQAFFQPPGTRE